MVEQVEVNSCSVVFGRKWYWVPQIDCISQSTSWGWLIGRDFRESIMAFDQGVIGLE